MTRNYGPVEEVDHMFQHRISRLLTTKPRLIFGDGGRVEEGWVRHSDLFVHSELQILNHDLFLEHCQSNFPIRDLVVLVLTALGR